MAKKCIPGVICIENMTLFILIVICVFLLYVYVNVLSKSNMHDSVPRIEIINREPKVEQQYLSNAITTRQNDILSNPYMPPQKSDYGFPSYPVFFDFHYSQKGILTKTDGTGDENLILPLMGRKLQRNRDKWQYYTMTNSGNFNTKLPISHGGRSCTNEYGCDELSNGDQIYVEGYNSTFIVTIYENNIFTYN